MKLNQNSVFHLLKSAHPEGLSVKKILSLLYLGANKRTQLRKILRQFGQNKVCYKSNNKYYIYPSAAQQEFVESVKTNKKRRSKQMVNTTEIGIWIFQGGKGYVQSTESSDQFKLPQSQATILIHGDVIRYKKMSGIKKQNQVELVDIIKRRINKIHGHLSIKKKKTVLVPDSSHFYHPFLIFEKKPDQKRCGLPAWIEIKKYPQNNIQPQGKLIPPLEKVIKESEEERLILNRYSLTKASPKLIEKESQSIPKQVRLRKSDQRTDLKDFPFITIDGADARDFDDAIFAKREETGYRIWISIADVSHYVQPKSNLDEQAQIRGNSIYLPSYAIPMLPEELSNDICSLNKHKNRLTMTCEILLGSDGEVVNFKIYQSIIRVCWRLTYDQVDCFFKTGNLNSSRNKELKGDLLLYLKISKLLRKKRIARGMIDFNLPETRFNYNKENLLVNISKHYQSDAQKLIEQFMLEANESVGKFCHQQQIPTIWRNHVDPISSDIEQIKQVLWDQQIKKSNLTNGKRINKILSEYQNSDQAYLIDKIILKTMSQARYDVYPQKHFGLGTDFYCHFTSPIRRYADLMVHRSIKSFIKEQKKIQIKQQLTDHLSNMERNTAKAERAIGKLKKTLFIYQQIGNLFTGEITGLMNHGVFITISSPFLEGFMPINTVLDDFYQINQNRFLIEGKKTKKQFTFGKKVTVQLTQIDLVNFSPEFEWVSW